MGLLSMEIRKTEFFYSFSHGKTMIILTFNHNLVSSTLAHLKSANVTCTENNTAHHTNSEF